MSFRRIFDCFLFLSGLFLLSINIYGLKQTIRHPDLSSFDQYGPKFIPIEIKSTLFTEDSPASVKLSSKLAKQRLRQILKKNNEYEIISDIQTLVTESMVHHYPVGEPFASNYFHVPVWENYLLYLAAKIYEFSEINFFSVFRPYEYLNGKKSWERGTAMCGEIASVVMYMLELANIKNGKAGLDGHVVALAELSNGDRYVVDADYGFIIEGSLADVSHNKLDEVYTLSGSRHLTEIYGPENNIEFWNGDRGYRPKGYWLEKGSYFFKWFLPTFLIFLSYFFYKNDKKRKNKQKLTHK